ncbi:MAG: prepilin-type N-terminal cleavage/methylation domain-containing protein [Fusobacterium sp.]
MRRYKKSKKKGFTIIEYMVYIFIIGIIISFTIIKINNFDNRLKIKEAIIKIVNIVDKYSSKSFRNEEYKLLFDSEMKEIRVYNLINKNPVEIINLPKTLNYRIPYNGKYQSKFIFNSTINSNLDKSFTIYIFSEKRSVYRISFYTFRISQIIKINVYKSLHPKIMDKETIIKNYTNEKFMKEGWIRINDY